MGNHNITPIVELRHRRNILTTVDVAPGVCVIDVIVVCTGGGRMDATKPDRRGMDVCDSGTSAMRPAESSSRRGRRESIC